MMSAYDRVVSKLMHYDMLRLREDIKADVYSLMKIREAIKKGGEAGKRMALSAIDKTAKDLFTPYAGITDFELITGKKPTLSEYGDSEGMESGILNLYNEIKHVLENEVKKEYGLNMQNYVQEYMDIQMNQIFAGYPDDVVEVGVGHHRFSAPSAPELIYI